MISPKLQLYLLEKAKLSDDLKKNPNFFLKECKRPKGIPIEEYLSNLNKGKNEKNSNLKFEREQKELEECTFHPRVNQL